MLDSPFFRLSHDILCILDRRGGLLATNHAWEAALGWNEDELSGRRLHDLVHPDDLDAVALDAGNDQPEASPVRFRGRLRCKDGSWRQLEWHAVLANGNRHIYAVARDMLATDSGPRRHQAREVHLARLLNEMHRIRHDEHQRVAGEIHDFALQHFLACRMYLQFLHEGTLAPSQVEPVEKALAQLEQGVEATRKIMAGLNPLDLATMSLESALGTALQELQLAYGVGHVLTCDVPCDLPERIAVVAFRVLRESATNAAKHASARMINVDLSCAAGVLSGAVWDDGTGFCVESATHRLPLASNGMGLPLIIEQVRALGGTAEIVSGDGSGTRVSFELPLEPSESPQLVDVPA